MGGRDRKSPGAYQAGGVAYAVAMVIVSVPMEGEDQDPRLSSDDHMWAGASMCACTHTHNYSYAHI